LRITVDENIYSSGDCRKSWQCSQFVPKIFKKYNMSQQIASPLPFLLSLSKIPSIRLNRSRSLVFTHLHIHIYAATVTKQSTLNQSRDWLLKLVPFLQRDSSPTKRQTLVDARVTRATFNPTLCINSAINLNFLSQI